MMLVLDLGDNRDIITRSIGLGTADDPTQGTPITFLRGEFSSTGRTEKDIIHE